MFMEPTEGSDGPAEVRVRIRPDSAEMDAAATIQRNQRKKMQAERARRTREEEEAERELDSARQLLRSNEEYFERMKRELEEQLKVEEEEAERQSAVKIQAISRGRDERKKHQERKTTRR